MVILPAGDATGGIPDWTMYTNNSNVTLACERLFLDGGPFFHLHTEPQEDNVIFRCDEERAVALNFMALAATRTACRLLAYALMSNHFHFILEGARESCEAFYADFQRRLAAWFSKSHRAEAVKACTPTLTPINSLKQLRNEIAYVIRNPYVARRDVNPLAYRWCSGYLYFNDMLGMGQPGTQVSRWSVQARRKFKHERDPEVDARIWALDGTALPSSFVDYRRAMSFFEDARQFTWWVLKNVEAQMETARRMGTRLSLNDDEMWSATHNICLNRFKVDSPQGLPEESRIQLARQLKSEFSTSNSQVARFARLPLETVNALFPLAAKPRP